MDGLRAGRLTRRELITRSAAAGAAAALAGADAGMAATLDDRQLLARVLQFERLSVRAYEGVLKLSFIVDPARAVLKGLLGHERAHVRRLESELLGLGGALPAPAVRDADVRQVLSEHGMSGGLEGLTTLKGAVQLLLDLGALCEGGYYLAVQKLSRPQLAVLAAQALASEGQHATLLSELIYPGQISQTVPDWYVVGVR